MVRRFAPWAGFVPEGNAHDLGFRAVSWLSREVLSFRDHRGRDSACEIVLRRTPEFPSQYLGEWEHIHDLSHFYLISIRGASYEASSRVIEHLKVTNEAAGEGYERGCWDRDRIADPGRVFRQLGDWSPTILQA
jgi:hypothetical protein